MTKKEIDVLIKKFDLKVKTKYSNEDLEILKQLVKTRVVGGTRTLSNLCKYIKENTKKDEPRNRQLPEVPKETGSEDSIELLLP